MLTLGAINIAAAIAALQPSAVNIEEDVLAVERRGNEAVSARDAATIADVLAHDFRFVAPDGSIYDRAAMLRMSADRDYVIESLQTRDVRVVADGMLATVSGCFRQTGTYHGQPFASTYRYVDAYRREPTGWRSFYAQAALVRAADAACR
jgi:ketosteroid isomerase-like protein